MLDGQSTKLYIKVKQNRFFQFYSMSKQSRGPALIINNEKFNDKSLTRTGSKVDRDNLNDLLDEFGFQVSQHYCFGEPSFHPKLLS